MSMMHSWATIPPRPVYSTGNVALGFCSDIVGAQNGNLGCLQKPFGSHHRNVHQEIGRSPQLPQGAAERRYAGGTFELNQNG